MDNMLDDVIVEPVLQEMTEEVAMDTLKYYGSKLKRKETKEVSEIFFNLWDLKALHINSINAHW